MVNKSADRSPERAREDYLKVIYSMGERRPARAADVARALGVTRASVSKFRRQLEREKLVEPPLGRTDALRLTKKGVRLALRMVRRHRLVETFLHETLHVPLDRVHTEAERIEHAISDDVCLRLARFLHHPATDPHGHPIPTSSAPHPSLREVPLSAVEPPTRLIVKSVDDRDPSVVRRLSVLGMLPGLVARVEVNGPDGLRLRVGRKTIHVPRDAANDVRCVPARPAQKAS
ncbi:MAG TPA: metal-dependent transcriptional regulator [Candidatus Acidoferrales bacterium]|nr:metal-dependent transcriptional regulator [Candidatus Acidoferrales bacterium]